MIVTSKRDEILKPFVQFRALTWPHKISKGFVKVYQTSMDETQARSFLVQHGYAFNRETEKAMSYTKTVGCFTVDVVYNMNDNSMLVAGERKR